MVDATTRARGSLVWTVTCGRGSDWSAHSSAPTRNLCRAADGAQAARGAASLDRVPAAAHVACSTLPAESSPAPAMPNGFRTRLPAALLTLGAACATVPRSAEQSAKCTFTNPVLAGADPWIVRHGDTYYLAQSHDRGIWIYRSDTLTRPDRHGVKVWSAPDTGWNRSNVWAPELHYLDGHWYIYYAAGRSGPPYLHQRAGVLESVSDDPQGRYVDRGMLYTGDSVATRAHPYWAIDLTVGRIGGRLYAIWSGWSGDATTDRTPQHLYAARMTNPYTIATNRVRIASPTAPWERGTELDLEEGPELLAHAGRVFVIYSSRESCDVEMSIPSCISTEGRSGVTCCDGERARCRRSDTRT